MGKTVFLFPGQGAQTVGMGKELLETEPTVKKLYDQAADILGYDLAKVCLEGPEELLNSTEVSQPAIYTGSFAALEVLKRERPELMDECQAAAGLSLGEYTALAFAQAMSFEDGLRLVQKRGQAMQASADATPSGMVSILGLEPEDVNQICDKILTEMPSEILKPANFLCPKNIVLSGTIAACKRAAEVGLEMGAMKTLPLAVAGAFHTDIMKPADEKLAVALEKVQMNSPRIPVYSNVDTGSHENPQEIKAILVKQILSPVRWEDTMRRFLAEGFETFCEIGPGRVLTGLMKRINRKVEMINFSI